MALYRCTSDAQMLWFRTSAHILCLTELPLCVFVCQALPAWRRHVGCHYTHAEPVHQTRHGNPCCSRPARTTGAVPGRGHTHAHSHSQHTACTVNIATVYDEACSAGSGHHLDMEKSRARAELWLPSTDGQSHSWTSGSGSAAQCQVRGVRGIWSTSWRLLFDAGALIWWFSVFLSVSDSVSPQW